MKDIIALNICQMQHLEELGIAPTFLDFIESISGGAKGVPLTTAQSVTSSNVTQD